MFARYMEAGYSTPNGRCHGFGEKVFGFDHLEGPSHCANFATMGDSWKISDRVDRKLSGIWINIRL